MTHTSKLTKCAACGHRSLLITCSACSDAAFQRELQSLRPWKQTCEAHPGGRGKLSMYDLLGDEVTHQALRQASGERALYLYDAYRRVMILQALDRQFGGQMNVRVTPRSKTVEERTWFT